MIRWQTLFLFLLGLCVGSFLNVVVYRLNHSLSPFRGCSFCPKCKKKIPWFDNIPLLSFVLLKGKCRFCHSPISIQYPLVELVTGLLTVFIFQLSNYGLQMGSYNLLISYALLTIFVSDLRYGTIPDKVVYFAIAVAFLYSQFVIRDSQFIINGLGASLFFLALFWITRGKGMGMGDVKLAGLMGLVLGWPKIIVALYLAFLTGAILGVILILLKKRRMGEHIPFGPFLTGATWISLFWGQVIWHFCIEKTFLF